MKLPAYSASQALMPNLHPYPINAKTYVLRPAADAAGPKWCREGNNTLVFVADPSYHITCLAKGSHATFRTDAMQENNLVCYYNGKSFSCIDEAKGDPGDLSMVEKLTDMKPEDIQKQLKGLFDDVDCDNFKNYPACPQKESKADKLASWR